MNIKLNMSEVCCKDSKKEIENVDNKKRENEKPSIN